MRYWLSATSSYLGDGVRVTAIPLLAASLSSSPGRVAAVSAAATLPWLLFGLPAGVLADRLPRARLMAWLQVGRGVAGLLAVVGVLTGHIGIAGLAGLAALLGTCEVPYDIASHALLPALVPAERLQWANGRLIGAEVSVFEMAGPALGGILFAVAAAFPFAVDAASFLVSAVLLSTLARNRPHVMPTATERNQVSGQILTGLRWFARAPVVRTLTLLAASINLGVGGFYAVLVLFARDELRLGSAGYGLLIAVSAVGSLAAVIAAGKIESGRARRQVCVWTAPVVAACFGLIAAVPSWLVAGAAMAVFGFAVSLFNVVAVSLRQALTPAVLMGRVLSVHRVLCWGALPTGALAAGAIADSTGLGWSIALCAVAIVVTWLATAWPLLTSGPSGTDGVISAAFTGTPPS